MLRNNLCKFWCCSKFHHTYVNKLQILCILKHNVGFRTLFMDVLGLSLNYMNKSTTLKLHLRISKLKLLVSSFKSHRKKLSQTSMSCEHKAAAQQSFNGKVKFVGLIKITISNWYKTFDLYLLWCQSHFQNLNCFRRFFLFGKHRIINNGGRVQWLVVLTIIQSNSQKESLLSHVNQALSLSSLLVTCKLTSAFQPTNIVCSLLHIAPPLNYWSCISIKLLIDISL